VFDIKYTLQESGSQLTHFFQNQVLHHIDQLQMVQYWDHQQQIFSFLDAVETPIFSIKETININQIENKNKSEKWRHQR
jgi:hypothetical protein